MRLWASRLSAAGLPGALRITGPVGKLSRRMRRNGGGWGATDSKDIDCWCEFPNLSLRKLPSTVSRWLRDAGVLPLIWGSD
ncbi:hypothetical protein SPHINGOT1_10164 [Sphingomonas sp. T1]|nr:hypothetical protein SPHINGOT1_10164 [Sphingomonas sp. T1]